MKNKIFQNCLNLVPFDSYQKVLQASLKINSLQQILLEILRRFSAEPRTKIDGTFESENIVLLWFSDFETFAFVLRVFFKVA